MLEQREWKRRSEEAAERGLRREDLEEEEDSNFGENIYWMVGQESSRPEG